MPPKPKLAYKMEITKQSQTAGDNSTQMQAGVINNNYTIIQGIDEARARSIWKEELAIARQEWTQEAQKTVCDRVSKLEEIVIPKMLEYDKTLSFFADPAFQFLLRKAQITAASSERETDYDMLADLLLHRLEQGENREQRLGITKAIEIVDQISEEAVLGLSLCYATLHLIPNAVDLHEGLSAHNELLEKIIGNKELPIGSRWIEHLDLLSVVRITPKSLGSFMKLSELKAQVFSKYFVSGVKEDSEEFKAIKDEFIQKNLPLSCFVPHPLKPDYVIFKLPLDIDNTCITQVSTDGKLISNLLTSEQKDTIKRVIDIANKDESKNIEMISKFMEEWDTFPTLNKVRRWWDAIPSHFTITSIGRAISYVYIHGKDPTVPYWC